MNRFEAHLPQFTSIAPLFKISTCNVDVIHSPDAFYQEVYKGICDATRHVILTSLYLGHEKLEMQLLDALRTKLSQNPSFQLGVHFDFLRGNRGAPSSFDLLKQLQKQFPNQVKISALELVETQSLLKRLFFSRRLRETFAVSHMKFIVCDSQTILTGANLSTIYFTNRVDRYIKLKDESLASYYTELFETLYKSSLEPSSRGQLEHALDEFISLSTKKYNDLAKEHAGLSKESSVFLFPTLQFGRRNIRQDQLFMESYLDYIQAMPGRVILASGYFNPNRLVKRLLDHTLVQRLALIVPSKEANGFHLASGVAGLIPYLYETYLGDFLKSSPHPNFPVAHCFTRPTWTFHAKGIWMLPDDRNEVCSTLIGSSNYGPRSLQLDIENQAFLFTTDKMFRNKLETETHRLMEHTAGCNRATLPQPYRLVQMLAYFCRRYL